MIFSNEPPRSPHSMRRIFIRVIGMLLLLLLGGLTAQSAETNPGAMGFAEWLSHDNFFEMNPVLSRNGGPPEMYPGEGSEVVIDQATRACSFRATGV